MAMTPKIYTPKMVRLMTAARRPLIKDGRGWRTTRAPVVRNRQNTGMVTLSLSTTFSGSALNRLLAGPRPELHVTRIGPSQRLQLTQAGKIALKHLPVMCIFCGCTDDRACPEGCSWTAPNICSACAVAP